MRLSRIVLSSTLLFATSISCFGYMHARRGPTSPSLFKKRSSRSVSHASSHTMGPRAMDSERATQIQTAMIRDGYMTGTPSGRWDAESEAAMQKLQSSKGWQTKLTPDSRALILLGLGPKNDQQATLVPNTSLSSAFTANAAIQP